MTQDERGASGPLTLRRLVDEPSLAAQTRLIDELVAGDVAALLFGVGAHFAAVPRGLREAARERGFPVLETAERVLTANAMTDRPDSAGDRLRYLQKTRMPISRHVPEVEPAGRAKQRRFIR